MRTIIEELLDQMNECHNRVEVMNVINARHSQLKSSLVNKGIKLYSDNEEIIGGQGMRRNDYEDYEQVNHIRRGLTSRWVHFNEEYSAIEHAVQDLLSRK